jgi:hypothetical protein
MASEQAERIGELLIEEGVVTHEDVLKAITDSGAKGTALALVLEGCKHSKRQDLAAFLASDFRVPKLDDLRKVDISSEAIQSVPEDVARKHELIPVAKFAGLLCIAKPNYYNRAAIQDVRRASGLKVKVFQADEGQVKAAIEKYYGRKGGDLPSPRAERLETAAFRAIPPAVKEESGREAVPLFGAADAPKTARRDDVVEVLTASKVPSTEFQDQEKHPHTRLVLQWEEMFVTGRPIQPTKVG